MIDSNVFICLRFVKQLYFSTSFYNNSLKAKTPEQFYFYPNPYLLSSFINQKIFTYRLSKIDPEKFWYDYKDEKEEKDLNSFFWLNLINRKNDGETIQKIIARTRLLIIKFCQFLLLNLLFLATQLAMIF